MFRKLIIASAVLAATSSLAFAANYKGDYKGEAAPAPCPPSGPNFVAAPYLGVAVGSMVNSGDGSYRSLNAQLFGGYGAMLNESWYLAGEIFGTPGNAKISDRPNSATATTYSYKTSWDWGLSIIPGYMLNNSTMAYLRGGWVQTRFNGSNVSQTKSGWQLGAGMETAIAQNWDLRGEYVYSRFKNVNNLGNVNSDRVNVGVVYKFV
jgi:opacity protein-like surface antigen